MIHRLNLSKFTTFFFLLFNFSQWQHYFSIFSIKWNPLISNGKRIFMKDWGGGGGGNRRTFCVISVSLPLIFVESEMMHKLFNCLFLGSKCRILAVNFPSPADRISRISLSPHVVSSDSLHLLKNDYLRKIISFSFSTRNRCQLST